MGALDDLQLLAPKQNYVTGIYVATSGIGEVQVITYYGHPRHRQRTVEDLRTIELYALASRLPVLVMGDFLTLWELSSLVWKEAYVTLVHGGQKRGGGMLNPRPHHWGKGLRV